MWVLTENKGGVVIYNWHGKVKFGLPLDIGDFVEILEENGAWFRGRCRRNPKEIGLFPKSYIHLKDLTKCDPIIEECTETLREWLEFWKKSYVNREMNRFKGLQSNMLSLIEHCRELHDITLPKEHILKLQIQITSKIDMGNRKLGIDLVPRVGPFSVDLNTVGIVGLHEAHLNSAEKHNKPINRKSTIKTDENNVNNYHLYVCLKEFDHTFFEDLELYFYLFDGNSEKMCNISERFLVKITRNKTFECIDKMHSTIFKDLGYANLNSNLFLVVNIMRVGRMIHTETIKKGKQYYKRPYCCGIRKLSNILKNDNIDFEQNQIKFGVRLFQCEEKDYTKLHEHIINKEIWRFSALTSGQNIYEMNLTMKLFTNIITDEMKSEVTSITRKIGFSNVFIPTDERNDLFLTLYGGNFEIGRKSTMKSIEISVVVADSNGKIIPNCIWSASNVELETDSYRSIILYHNNLPCWNETLRLSIPTKIFNEAHVVFEFRHCSIREKKKTKVFGFSFMRLTESTATAIFDGVHDLYVYKCKDPTKFLSAEYLNLSYFQNDDQAKQHTSLVFQWNSNDIFHVNTKFCSTKLTQNKNLMALLLWKIHPTKVNDYLTKVNDIEDEEIVKFSQDILQVLFEIFSSNINNNPSMIFDIIVNIFSLIQTTKFEHFKPIINTYIEEKFSAFSIHNELLFSIKSVALKITTSENFIQFFKCFQSIEYIFKVIMKSKNLDPSKQEFNELFNQNIRSVFNSFYEILKIPLTNDENIIVIQTTLLHSIGVIFEQLQGILPAEELALIAKNLLNSVPKHCSHELILGTLKAFKELISGYLFLNDESRIIILSSVCKHLHYHLPKKDDLELCAEVLNKILLQLFKLKKDKPTNAVKRDITIFCKNMINIVIETIQKSKINNDNKINVTQLVTILFGLLQEINDANYNYLWDELKNNSDLKNFLSKILMIFKEILTQDWKMYPNDWLVMKLAANKTIEKVLEEFSKQISLNFNSKNSFDYQIWWQFFNLKVIFICQPCLQLEKYKDRTYLKIIKSHGDMRVSIGFQIIDLWSQLGENKIHFIPSLIEPFLEITLIPKLNLRKASLTILYDMMQCEQSIYGSLKIVQNELIDKLDLLINKKKGDHEYRDLFSSILIEKVYSENPKWKDESREFISSMTLLLQLLLDYRSVMMGTNNREKLMTCVVNLLNFYKNDVRGKEKYLKHIYKLYELHLDAKNYIEAGYTLKLYADTLSWDKETLIFTPNDSTGSPECERKENLYHEIIKLFDSGKMWEKAIPLCKELSNFYENKLYDYVKVCEILKIQEQCFEKILNQVRHETEYFRVGFFGMGFPYFIRNKTFVYRGLEYERMGAFTERLQVEFPQAEILTTSSSPDETYNLSSGQYIQIINVKPIANFTQLLNAPDPLPLHISRFFMFNDVTKFVNDKPIHKLPIDKQNEIKSLWIQRTTIEIDNKLPGILKWFEVATSSTIEISPLVFACETMENVNRELLDLTALYKLDTKRSLNPFTMRLQGVIDANVQGGISKYQEAFFSKGFLKGDNIVENAKLVQKLKGLIRKQSEIVERALELHGKLISFDVMPLHNLLLVRFGDLRLKIDSLPKQKRPFSESIVNLPLPELPPIARKSTRPMSIVNICTDNIYIEMGKQKIEENDYLEPSNLVDECDAPPDLLPKKIIVKPITSDLISFDPSENKQNDVTYYNTNCPIYDVIGPFSDNRDSLIEFPTETVVTPKEIIAVRSAPEIPKEKTQNKIDSSSSNVTPKEENIHTGIITVRSPPKIPVERNRNILSCIPEVPSIDHYSDSDSEEVYEEFL